MRRILAILVLALVCAPALAQPVPMAARAGQFGVIGWASNINLNAVGDTFIPIRASTGSYIVGGEGSSAPLEVFLITGNCSAAASTARVGLNTGPTGGGTILVSAAGGPASAANFQQRTGASNIYTVFSTASQPGLYYRVSVAQGSPVTCDAYVYGMWLP